MSDYEDLRDESMERDHYYDTYSGPCCAECGSTNLYAGHRGGLEVEPEPSECRDCGCTEIDV